MWDGRLTARGQSGRRTRYLYRNNWTLLIAAATNGNQTNKVRWCVTVSFTRSVKPSAISSNWGSVRRILSQTESSFQVCCSTRGYCANDSTCTCTNLYVTWTTKLHETAADDAVCRRTAVVGGSRLSARCVLPQQKSGAKNSVQSTVMFALGGNNSFNVSAVSRVRLYDPNQQRHGPPQRFVKAQSLDTIDYPGQAKQQNRITKNIGYTAVSTNFPGNTKGRTIAIKGLLQENTLEGLKSPTRNNFPTFKSWNWLFLAKNFFSFFGPVRAVALEQPLGVCRIILACKL